MRPETHSELIPPARKIEFESCKKCKKTRSDSEFSKKMEEYFVRKDFFETFRANYLAGLWVLNHFSQKSSLSSRFIFIFIFSLVFSFIFSLLVPLVSSLFALLFSSSSLAFLSCLVLSLSLSLFLCLSFSVFFLCLSLSLSLSLSVRVSVCCGGCCCVVCVSRCGRGVCVWSWCGTLKTCVRTFKTSPCLLAPRPHVVTLAGVVPVHTETF